MEDDAKLTAAADVSAEADGNDELADPRIERIEQYIAEAQKSSDDSLQACLGGVSGDLMLLHYEMCRAVQDTFEDLKQAERTLTEIVPAVNTVAKLSQQVERYQHLIRKLREAPNGD